MNKKVNVGHNSQDGNKEDKKERLVVWNEDEEKRQFSKLNCFSFLSLLVIQY